jgi:glycosyltransferase involved in cell wall biosynthesis
MGAPNYNIAIYLPSMEHFGGIESVIIQQLHMFSEAGYNTLLLTDQPVKLFANRISAPCRQLPTSYPEREEAWSKELATFKIDFVLLNGAAFTNTSKDIETIHTYGAKAILTIHFSFPSFMIFNESWDILKINREIGKKCDAVVTLSDTDKKWWECLDCKTVYIPNPTTFQRPEPHHSDGRTLIWVGRYNEQKLPDDALEIVSKIAKEIPDVKLIIVGVSATKSIRKKLQHLGIEKNVELAGVVTNAMPYYARADIHLLTSITESFCLVIAEAKVNGIPTAMYSIPFLELVKDGKGVVATERCAEILADEIIVLLQNPSRLKRLKEQVAIDIDAFAEEAVCKRWNNLFNNLTSNKEIPQEANADVRVIVNQIYQAWEYQRGKNQHKIEVFANYTKLTHNSGRRIGRCMQQLINLLRKLR